MNFFRKYARKNTNPQQQTELVQRSLTANLDKIRQQFKETPDLIIRTFEIKQTKDNAALIYLSGMVDKIAIHNNILKPLLFESDHNNKHFDPTVTIGHIENTSDWSKVEDSILQGNSVLFVDNRPETFIYSTQGWPERSIEDSQIEPSLKGTHIGFTESGNQNISLIRRHVANRELKIKELTIGERSKTKVSILYVADIAKQDVLQELEHRISKLNIDDILNSGMVAEYIEDNPFSPFPQLLMTERPDTAALQLLEGRIVTVVDKSPSVLVAPVSFITFFESIDDYGTRWGVASFIRLLRYFAFLIAIFLPAIYIAIITFHPEVIPIKLLISIGESRERVPFHPLLEAFIMEITLELLREAGIRLPASIGQTVGIVGGIVIGQAAVEAGIVSNIMVIVVALTAIASFNMPNYDMGAAIRMIRFPMMIAAGMFGLLGIVIGLMTLVIHFITLESLGTPYGSPIAPLRFSDWKNALIRLPEWSRVSRPESSRAVQEKKANPK